MSLHVPLQIGRPADHLATNMTLSGPFLYRDNDKQQIQVMIMIEAQELERTEVRLEEPAFFLLPLAAVATMDLKLRAAGIRLKWY